MELFFFHIQMPNRVLELENAHTLNCYLARMYREHIHGRFAKAKAFFNYIATFLSPWDAGGIALIDFIDFMYSVNVKVKEGLERRCLYVPGMRYAPVDASIPSHVSLMFVYLVLFSRGVQTVCALVVMHSTAVYATHYPDMHYQVHTMHYPGTVFGTRYTLRTTWYTLPGTKYIRTAWNTLYPKYGCSVARQMFG